MQPHSSTTAFFFFNLFIIFFCFSSKTEPVTMCLTILALSKTAKHLECGSQPTCVMKTAPYCTLLVS